MAVAFPRQKKDGSSMAEEKLTTPGGCRIFRGKCFEALEYDAGLKEVRAEFRDGSVYIYSKVPIRTFEDWTERLDPGCFFNSSGQPWPFKRIRPPN